MQWHTLQLQQCRAFLHELLHVRWRSWLFSRFTIKQMNSEDDEVSLSASDNDDAGQYHEYIYR